ncbi:HNH endonuclease family protein (plasmid) [Streptomyces sp. NBC_00963]|uniref:HNH endonuclease family protein n=1 Tax=Streptomyces sp. NBC_00963 TaxID=2903697 RepID=UPI002F90D6B1|nr:HNH endonuclease family protein [Streptomyces sp. NBC_00963]
MIKNLMRGLAAAALLSLPLAAAAPAPAVSLPLPHAAPAAVTMSLTDGIAELPVAAEHREGYERTKFKHWVDADHNGCNTRAEVLIAESRTKPVIEAGCKIASGTWYSYYDGVTVTAPGGLDIDHMVPLAEAWDSGASNWTAARRQAYANDLDAPRSLVAVSAKANRSKSDQDVTDWLPPLADARCQYASDWTSTKLRWGLSIDSAERTALEHIASGCGHTNVEYETALP